MGVIALASIYLSVPETKGKSLEEVEVEMTRMGGVMGIQTALMYYLDFRKPYYQFMTIHGDLWSIDLRAIEEVASFERELRTELSASLLHELLPYSFGFACGNFKYPIPLKNFHATVDPRSPRYLQCPLHAGVEMPREVGAISFTAPTFKNFFFDGNLDFSFVSDLQARLWFKEWFYGAYQPMRSRVPDFGMTYAIVHV
eukprot:31479-Pelagococcus_subviridis.AAC.41